MQRILALFKERDTRDELGVGSIRDLIADGLFPGTSTIQTRLRYMLFVPWLYQGLETEECPSARITREARKREVALVAGLLGSDDTAGVFGKRAGGELERLPSSVYWSGLGAWGLRRFEGSQEQYHQWIDEIYRSRRERGRRQQAADRRGEGADAVGAAQRRHLAPQAPQAAPWLPRTGDGPADRRRGAFPPRPGGKYPARLPAGQADVPAAGGRGFPLAAPPAGGVRGRTPPTPIPRPALFGAHVRGGPALRPDARREASATSS